MTVRPRALRPIARTKKWPPGEGQGEPGIHATPATMTVAIGRKSPSLAISAPANERRRTSDRVYLRHRGGTSVKAGSGEMPASVRMAQGVCRRLCQRETLASPPASGAGQLASRARACRAFRVLRRVFTEHGAETRAGLEFGVRRAAGADCGRSIIAAVTARNRTLRSSRNGRSAGRRGRLRRDLRHLARQLDQAIRRRISRLLGRLVLTRSRCFRWYGRLRASSVAAPAQAADGSQQRGAMGFGGHGKKWPR